MIDREQNCRSFFNSMFTETFPAPVTDSLVMLQLHHVNWVSSKGWHNKQPLEYIALICSEVYEVWEAHSAPGSDVSKIQEEVSDIVLRIIDFIYVMDEHLQCMPLYSILTQETVIDNRLDSLNTSEFILNDYLFALFLKVSSVCNHFRSAVLEMDSVLSSRSALNQSLYLCFLILDRYKEKDEDILTPIRDKIAFNLERKSVRFK